MNTLETQMIKLEKDVEYINKTMDDLKSKVNTIDTKIDAVHERLDEFAQDIHDGFVKKDEFIFWRNLLISGILIIIFVGIVMQMIGKVFN